MDNDLTIFSDISEFAPFIRMRRLALGMTQKDLASAMDVMPHHISRLENGAVEPKLTTVLALLKALDVKLGAVPSYATKPEHAS